MDIKNYIVNGFYHIFGAPFRLLPIRNKTVLLEAYYGRGYTDSPRAIAEELHRRNIEDLKLIWLFRTTKDKDSLPNYIHPVKRFTFKELYYLATSKIWIDNCRKNAGMLKRKKQFYIQTWHAGLHGKRVEKDVAEHLSGSYVRNAMHDSKMADLFISGSSWETELYRNSFWYKGAILEKGLPRNDIFFENSSDIVSKVYRTYSISSEYKIVLYAPTFRVDADISQYDLDYERLIQNLSKYWGGNWVIIIRMHPSAVDLQNTIKYSSNIINGTYYPEINELIIASELMITDYSSCIFDALLANKRIIQYASDIKKYMGDRGTYFSLEDMPFPLAQDNDEMEKQIKDYKVDEEQLRQANFLSSKGSFESGNASQAVADLIVNIIENA